MKINASLRATLLKGLAAVLPVYVLLMIAGWIIEQVPLAAFIQEKFSVSFWVAAAYALVFDIACIYAAGLFVESRYGRPVVDWAELQLHRVPGYSLIAAMVERLFGSKKIVFGADSALKVVAFSAPWGSGWSIGFVTKAGKRWSSIAIPTSPMPATGFTQIMRNESLIELDMTVLEAVQYTFTFGVNVAPDRIGAMIESAPERKRMVPY